MAIRVVCPNGHTLHVKDSLGGRTGLCPFCKVRVHVPKPHRGEVSEDAIMDILGPAQQGVLGESGLGLTRELDEGLSTNRGSDRPPMKCCDKCNQQIDAGTRVCPYCHTYLANTAEL